MKINSLIFRHAFGIHPFRFPNSQKHTIVILNNIRIYLAQIAMNARNDIVFVLSCLKR